MLDILLKAVKEGIRFKKLDCLKVVKAILRNNPMGTELEAKTVSKLFFLYKSFVFHNNAEVRACVNLLIRYQRLTDEDVAWLVSTWDKSEHSLNRLLRYPEKHPLITKWAEEIYQQGQLAHRQAEVIAILLGESIPPFVEEDDATIIWATYYAAVSDEVKQRLLLSRFSFENLDSLWEVSVRLKYTYVIEAMKDKVRMLGDVHLYR
ncbi:MAG: hypothetical protein HYX93_04915 [Chloroflexi bacterium]|nr:hypothetical protein [Chloroflexota bacterium]